MKYLTKISVSFIVGLCLIISGLMLGGFHYLDVKAMDDQSFICDRIDVLDLDVHYFDIDVREDNVDHVHVYASDLLEGTKLVLNEHTLTLQQKLYPMHHRKPHLQITVPYGYEFKEVKMNLNMASLSSSSLKSKVIRIKSKLSQIILKEIKTSQLEIDALLSKIKVYTQDESIEQRQIQYDLSYIQIDYDEYKGLGKEEK